MRTKSLKKNTINVVTLGLRVLHLEVGTTNNSWGFKSYDNDWKSPNELLFWLIEIVSKGGNYMLNIGQHFYQVKDLVF